MAKDPRWVDGTEEPGSPKPLPSRIAVTCDAPIVAPGLVWRPKLVSIPAEFAAELRAQGLRVIGIHVLEQDSAGMPTKAEVELGPDDDEETEEESDNFFEDFFDPGEHGHPSWELCLELAGSAPAGNVGDLADIVAQYVENAELSEEDRGADAPDLSDALEAIGKIRDIIDRAEARVTELGERG